MLKTEYFECHCHSDEHRLTFAIDDEFDKDWPPELWAGSFLCQHLNVFQRAWVALKYLFGYKCKYGHFDCFVMKPEDAPKFQQMVEKYMGMHNKWVKELKERDNVRS